jgi:prepilin-type processing-associated H-X9-DG protein
MQCSNHLKQLTLGMHNYHDSHGHFPSAMGGTGVGATPADGNANRLSGLVALMPYIEGHNADRFWEQVSHPAEFDGVTYPAMGPAPWVEEYAPWQEKFPTLRCPSASDERMSFGQTNYAFCVGDVAHGIHQPAKLRGSFACGMTSRFDDIADGSSNTIAMGEIGTPAGLSVIGQFAINQPADFLANPSLCLGVRVGSRQNYREEVSLSESGRGSRWADGAAGFSLFNTVLPPNSPSCAVGGTEAVDGFYSVGSLHPGGAMVSLVDGSVRFISYNIDAGDPTQAPLTPEQFAHGRVASPYGVWGALGTAAGQEDVGSY